MNLNVLETTLKPGAKSLNGDIITEGFVQVAVREEGTSDGDSVAWLVIDLDDILSATVLFLRAVKSSFGCKDDTKAG